MCSNTNIAQGAEVSERNPVIGICENCKFFSPKYLTHGECLKGFVTFSEYETDPDLEGQMVIVDGSGELYSFKCHVSKKFGCINFTSK